jgi:ABC-type multidrug transport system ATPase subunit
MCWIHRTSSPLSTASPPSAWDKLQVRFTSLPTSLQQRAMIARALLQNTPVLLLDEPFACLDDWAVMVRSMAQWTYTAPPLPGSSLPEKLPRTILLATKSVETAKACDEVLFLQNGRVMEQGPLEDLMKRKGAYYRYMRRAELVYMLDADTAAVQPAFLQELWPLSELGLDAVEELAALFLTQRFDKGDIIFNQGALTTADTVCAYWSS